MLGGKLAKLILFLAIFIWASSAPASFGLQDYLLITHIQTGGQDSASDELIKIQNTTAQDLSLEGVVLQYKSVNGSSWSTKSELSGSLASGQEAVVASEQNEEFDLADFILKSGMATSSGHVRIFDNNTDLELDLVGWGEASNPSGKPTQAHDKGGYIYRLQNSEDLWFNTKDNSADFAIYNIPSEEPADNNSPTALDGSLENYELTFTTFPIIEVTEIMPDPKSPLTDKEDEFIELFNPNAEAVNLEDYVISVGLNNSKAFVMPKFSIGPGEYFALFSEDSNLTLSNTTSQVNVAAPNGDKLFESPIYEDAQAGESYILSSTGQWLWTQQPTPNKLNVYKAKIELAKASSDTKESESEDSNTFGSGGSDRDYNPDEVNVYERPASVNQASLNTAVLVGVGGLALCYACYEYRYDLSNRYHRLVGYFKAR